MRCRCDATNGNLGYGSRDRFDEMVVSTNRVPQCAANALRGMTTPNREADEADYISSERSERAGAREGAGRVRVVLYTRVQEKRRSVSDGRQIPRRVPTVPARNETGGCGPRKRSKSGATDARRLKNAFALAL
jgi:hypothetical protein